MPSSNPLKAVSARKESFQKEKAKFEKQVMELQAAHRLAANAARAQVDQLTEDFAAAEPEAKPELEQAIAKCKAEAAALEGKLAPGGCPDIAAALAQVAVAEAAKDGQVIRDLEAIVAEKEANYLREQSEADAAATAREVGTHR